MQAPNDFEHREREPVPRRRVHQKRSTKSFQERYDTWIDYADIALYWFGNKIAYIMAFGVAFWLWYIGARFTLLAIQDIFPFTVSWGLSQWFIPVGVSAVEMIFSRRKGWHFYLFLFVSGLDMLTTVYGTLEWAAGRNLEVGTGIHIPQSGFGLIVPTTIVAFVLTFGPERLAMWALRSIVGLERYEDE